MLVETVNWNSLAIGPDGCLRLICAEDVPAGRAGSAAALDAALGVSSQDEFAGEDLGSLFGIELEADPGGVVKAGRQAREGAKKEAVKSVKTKAVKKVVKRAKKVKKASVKRSAGNSGKGRSDV